MINQYIFKSKRLGFRNWTNEGLQECSKLNSDTEVMEHFPKLLTSQEVMEFIGQLRTHFDKNGFTYYATEILQTKEFVGMMGLDFQEYKSDVIPPIDIGWRLKRAAWGKGLGVVIRMNQKRLVLNRVCKSKGR